jgi:hypothetical protein
VNAGEPSGYIKCWETIKWLYNWWPLVITTGSLTTNHYAHIKHHISDTYHKSHKPIKKYNIVAICLSQIVPIMSFSIGVTCQTQEYSTVVTHYNVVSTRHRHA